MKKCLFSRHIPKDSVTEWQAVASDMETFNRAVRTAFSWNGKDPDALKTSGDTEKPDMRLKENRDLRKQAAPSVHMRLKERFGMNDYFANSANRTAKEHPEGCQ